MSATTVLSVKAQGGFLVGELPHPGGTYESRTSYARIALNTNTLEGTEPHRFKLSEDGTYWLLRYEMGKYPPAFLSSIPMDVWGRMQALQAKEQLQIEFIASFYDANFKLKPRELNTDVSEGDNVFITLQLGMPTLDLDGRSILAALPNEARSSQWLGGVSQIQLFAS